MEQLVTFKKNGYDPFIDYLKGVCIFFIVLTHCVPTYLIDYIQFDLWGRTAVPLLLLLQVFHSYKKGVEQSKISLKRIWKRVALPFFITEAVIILLFPLVTSGTSYKDLLSTIPWGGGIGPGCYYPWIYIEMAIIIPLCAYIFMKIKGKRLLFTFIFISQLFEVVICIINLPEWAYRLSFFKYFFLIYLGYLLATEGLAINKKTISVSLISLASIFFFLYSNIDLRPVFCTQYDVWIIFHWICYFYMAYLFLYLLKLSFKKLSKYERTINYIKEMGIYSYEIFLFQLFYYSIIAVYVDQLLSYITYTLLADLIRIIIAVIICIVPVIYFKKKTST